MAISHEVDLSTFSSSDAGRQRLIERLDLQQNSSSILSDVYSGDRSLLVAGNEPSPFEDFCLMNYFDPPLAGLFSLTRLRLESSIGHWRLVLDASDTLFIENSPIRFHWAADRDMKISSGRVGVNFVHQGLSFVFGMYNGYLVTDIGSQTVNGVDKSMTKNPQKGFHFNPVLNQWCLLDVHAESPDSAHITIQSPSGKQGRLVLPFFIATQMGH